MPSTDLAPDLTVIVVTHNSAHVVGALLDSLPQALDGLRAEVIVVDNASADQTRELLAARTDCRLVRSANVGYSAGINLGVRHAAVPAPAILILNPDVRLHPRSVREMLRALGEPGTGIVAPQVRSATGALDLSLRREPTLPRSLGLTRRVPLFSEYVAERSAYTAPGTVDWANGAVLLMSRHCYDLLGGWDESYFLFSEETDVALRARDSGLLTRYEPAAVATHIGGQSGRNATTHAMLVVNRVRLYRRRHGAIASWCYYLVTLAKELSRIARGQRRARAGAVALLCPARRPACLGCSASLMPR